MAINERIKFFRQLRGMTQKFLGQALGFPENSADVRMAQYETGTRTPKENGVADLAKELKVSTFALDVPNFDTPINVIHSLFALEDIFGFEVKRYNDEIAITINPTNTKGEELAKMLKDWCSIYERYAGNEFWRSEYDDWRYNYPQSLANNKLWCNPMEGKDIYPEPPEDE